MRRRAELSADPEEAPLPFFDSEDICNICEFSMNDPIKKLKRIVKYIHEPCLVKS